MERLPVVYVRGYAGATSGIDSQVDDPFYGFNLGATHVRVGGSGDPMFYQFEGPMLRLITDENYRLLVHGDQRKFLDDAGPGTVPKESLWVYRFYDQAATTFGPQPHDENFFERVWREAREHVTADKFNLEVAAEGLYELIKTIREKTGAEKVIVVAHSMGGLVVRCMMQKVCQDGSGRLPAKDIVAKFFTYGTPHGGIAFSLGALDWAQQAFGPAGADVFAPEKMYGYLTPGKKFGDLPDEGDNWDPQYVDPEVFSPDNIFCIVGTDPKDYGLARKAVGPKSDGLVRIEHAYVRQAHRAYVYKSHSGSYGEVNSEEGYQNLRRFLFGRWAVKVSLDGLPAYPEGMDEGPAEQQWPVWQADMGLAIRGLSVVISEQQAGHWCPIQINDELRRLAGSEDKSVPLVSTFLLDPAHERELAIERHDAEPAVKHDGLLRYSLSLKVYKVDDRGGFLHFGDHLEKTPDWGDSLIVDVAPNADQGLQAWAAWNHDVEGLNASFDPISMGRPEGQRGPLAFAAAGGVMSAGIDLPDGAKALPILGAGAHLTIQVTDRLAPQ
jgi:pimeloyl-ACP methyl ester carboxylesterase